MAVLRKTVTVLFCDVADSTPLGERLDPEVLQRILSRYHEEMKVVLERHGGTVEKFIGDAVMAVFGIPTAHDDDALRAIRAALEIRTALAELNRELLRDFDVEISVRTGVNTGEVVAGDPAAGQAFATGHAVVVAERLQKAARSGETLLGETTRRLVENAALVEPVESLKVKGKKDAVESWRLVGVLEGAPPFARRLDAPMVGRVQELATLRSAFDEAVEESACRLVTVVGSAGIGKSRLASELLATVGDEASLLVGRCLPYGEGITYWPLRDVVREAAGDLTQAQIEDLLEGEEDAERIAGRVAGAIGISDHAGAADETNWAVRRLFERMASDRPLIVGFDDLQWAEPTFLELVEYLVGWSRDAPILVVCLARPELFDRHPTWLTVKPNSSSIVLEPLSELEAGSLLEHLRGEAELSSDLLERITQAADGNPLFVEQMLAMMIEEGSPASELAIPPSIHALLAARLDRLEPEERAVMERAAVVGRDFWRGSVADLSPEEARPRIGTHLMALVRKDLIRPSRSVFPREDGFRFRHILIRDAAYLGIAKETRADLHERYAAWLGRTAGDRANEFDEIVGYHLEQAFRYRQELGPVGEADLALATGAGERLGAAGRRAIVTRGDLSGAVNLISRATSLLPTEHPLRRELLPELGSALMRTGDFGRAEGVLTEAMEAAAAAGDRRLELRTIIEREFFRTFTHPEGSVAEIVAVAEKAIPLLEELDDDLGLAKAWWLKSEVYVNACQWGARASDLERALDHARRAGDSAEVATITSLLAQALYYGPTPVPEAIERCEQYVEEHPENRSLGASVTGILAGLRAMRGEFDEARRLQKRAREIHEELGQRFRVAARSLVAAEIELLAGRPSEAVAILRWAYETLLEMGATSVMSTTAAFLADALCFDGKLEEAEDLSRISEANAAGVDVVTQVLWRTARARAVAPQSEETAVELAREALARGQTTDYPDLEARALASLAEVLGPGDEASRLLDEARTVHERKGNIAAAARLSANLLHPS
jgi:class 3 adenylate cyclase/tetratricopeptide (TPR) repeat protein